MTNILVFGDSITWGAWDKEGGWVQRLRKFVDKKNLSDLEYDCMIYNLGVSGDTMGDLLERFEFETKQRLKEEETIIIFGVGINDSQFIHDKNDLRIKIEDFEDNIKKLIKLSKKYSKKIIFVGLNPVDDAKVDPMRWAMNKSYRTELVKKFDEKIKKVCKQEKVYFVEIYRRLIKENFKSLLEDGAHPNPKGHEKIFEIVKEFLVKNKII